MNLAISADRKSANRIYVDLPHSSESPVSRTLLVHVTRSTSPTRPSPTNRHPIFLLESFKPQEPKGHCSRRRTATVAAGKSRRGGRGIERRGRSCLSSRSGSLTVADNRAETPDCEGRGERCGEASRGGGGGMATPGKGGAARFAAALFVLLNLAVAIAG